MTTYHNEHPNRGIEAMYHKHGTREAVWDHQKGTLMKRFMLGLTTIVALVAMTLLGLTAPAAHADDSVPTGTRNPAVVLNPDVVSGYPGTLITVNVLQNDLGPNLTLMGYRSLSGSGVTVKVNYPQWGDLSVVTTTPQTVTLEALVYSNGDTSVVYPESLTAIANPYGALVIKPVKGKKHVLDVYSPNPNCPTSSHYCWVGLNFVKSAPYNVQSQQHTRIKIKQDYKYLVSHKKVTLVVTYSRDYGFCQMRSTLKYPMGKKAYKQYKKAHKKHGGRS